MIGRHDLWHWISCKLIESAKDNGHVWYLASKTMQTWDVSIWKFFSLLCDYFQINGICCCNRIKGDKHSTSILKKKMLLDVAFWQMTAYFPKPKKWKTQLHIVNTLLSWKRHCVRKCWDYVWCKVSNKLQVVNNKTYYSFNFVVKKWIYLSEWEWAGCWI